MGMVGLAGRRSGWCGGAEELPGCSASIEVSWVVLRNQPPSLDCLLPYLAWLFTLMVFG